MTHVAGSDESAKEALVNYISLNLSVAELKVHRVLITGNQSANNLLSEPHVLSASNHSGKTIVAEPHVLPAITLPHASSTNGKTSSIL